MRALVAQVRQYSGSDHPSNAATANEQRGRRDVGGESLFVEEDFVVLGGKEGLSQFVIFLHGVKVFPVLLLLCLLVSDQ